MTGIRSIPSRSTSFLLEQEQLRANCLSGKVDLRRGALVSQYSGENWGNLTLRLSTLELTGQLAPQEVREVRRRLIDKEQLEYKSTSRMIQADSASLADPVIEAPVIMEEAASMVDIGEAGVTYTAPLPVNIASGVDQVRVALDSLQFDARRFARAAPRYDETAFLGECRIHTADDSQ